MLKAPRKETTIINKCLVVQVWDVVVGGHDGQFAESWGQDFG
jgi:hypothetical protein